MTGDHINILGKSYYFQTTTSTTNQPLDYSSVINNLFSGPNSTVIKGATSNIVNTLNLTTSAISSFISDPNRDKDATDNVNLNIPKAYINWILFDDNFKVKGSGFSRVGAINMVKDHFTDASLQNIPVTNNGYLYVFVSNESQVKVYFDNLQVVHTRGPVLEESHYYPYGLKIAGISFRAGNKLANLYGYQGSFSEEETETAWDEFELRRYDPQTGRWTGNDPYNQFASGYVGMGNNPANSIDPDGGMMTPGAYGAIAGAVTGGVAAYLIAHNNGAGDWGSAGFAAMGALAGAGIGYGIGESSFDHGNMGSAGFLGHFRAFYSGLFNGSQDLNGWSSPLGGGSGGGASIPDIWGSIANIFNGGGGTNFSNTLNSIAKTVEIDGGIISRSGPIESPKRTSPIVNISPISPGPRPHLDQVVRIRQLPFGPYSGNSPEGGSYADPTISDEQFNVIRQFVSQVRGRMMPGDVIINATLTQNMMSGNLLNKSNTVPNVGGAGWDYNPNTGRRIDNGLGVIRLLTGEGNTIFQNFQSQTNKMAMQLRSILSASVSPLTNWRPPNPRYLFQGMIRRRIITYRMVYR